jgi:hypothetical protein
VQIEVGPRYPSTLGAGPPRTPWVSDRPSPALSIEPSDVVHSLPPRSGRSHAHAEEPALDTSRSSPTRPPLARSRNNMPRGYGNSSRLSMPTTLGVPRGHRGYLLGPLLCGDSLSPSIRWLGRSLQPGVARPPEAGP